jgi:two-component system, NtrC family, sensor histidine kinase HydH
LGGLVAAVVLGGLCFRKRILNLKTNNNTNDEAILKLSELTGHLAHELKNPLSIIKVNLKLIGEDAESGDIERAGRKISVVQKETERLEQILEGFLKYVGKTELDLCEADINELVSDMVDFYTPEAVKNSIMMRSLLCEEPLICEIDVTTLKQVILNMFINAGQAMEDGGELIVQTAKDGAKAVIKISDTGKGIEADKIDKIFNAFYTSRRGGSGLGLAVAKKIVEAHDGQINVDSEIGKGTKFEIKLNIKN